jgi:hypothetical protein
VSDRAAAAPCGDRRGSDATIAELGWEYNHRAARVATRPSQLRAGDASLGMTGKNDRRGRVRSIGRTSTRSALGVARHDGEALPAWVRRVLVPRLWRGAIVVLDNLAARKQVGVRAAIERAWAHVKVLPPYSHDFNPTE